MKFIKLFFEIIFWLLLLISKVLLLGLIILIIDSFVDLSNSIIIGFMIIGILWGIYFAEKIRRKYGCTAYWSAIYSTADIYPTSIDLPKKDSKKESNELPEDSNTQEE